MSYTQFYDSLFELADTWTADINPISYAGASLCLQSARGRHCVRTHLSLYHTHSYTHRHIEPSTENLVARTHDTASLHIFLFDLWCPCVGWRAADFLKRLFHNVIHSDSLHR